jgi:hypothetical protein
MIGQRTSHLDSAKPALQRAARRVFLHPENLNLIRFSTVFNALISRRITLAHLLPSSLSYDSITPKTHQSP